MKSREQILLDLLMQIEGMKTVVKKLLVQEKEVQANGRS
jgi:hypothetical protein